MAGQHWHMALSGRSVTVRLDTKDRMKLTWEKVDGILEAGACELLAYPSVEALDGGTEAGTGERLEKADQIALELMIEKLIETHGESVQQLQSGIANYNRGLREREAAEARARLKKLEEEEDAAYEEDEKDEGFSSIR